MNHPWELSPFSVLTEEGDPNHKKELAKCPEFTLYEHFRPGGPTSVELSPEVEGAYHRVKGNINDAAGREKRVEMASLLDHLGNLGKLRMLAPESADTDAIIKSLGAKLFPEILQLLGIPISEALSLAGRKRETAVQDIVTAFKGGLDILGRNQTPKFEKAKNGQAMLPIQRMMIPAAVAQFRQHRERPTQTRIREFLEGMGYRRVKDDSWTNNFNKAGLGTLPR